jgi:enoyl-CoA hydratase/carnithine racemase
MTAVLERAPAVFEAPDDEGIGRILIDRPDDRVNALDPALIEAIGAAVRAARALPELRGLLLVSG